MEDVNMSEVVDEIKSANKEELRDVIEKHFSQMRYQGMKIGATYLSAAIFSVIQKHIKKKAGTKASLRDYQRCIDEISQIISVQLTQQNDSEETAEEDNKNDRTEE